MTDSCRKTKRKNLFDRIGNIAAGLIVFYLILAVFLPFIFDGHLYHLESPFPATPEGNVILIRVERRSLISREALNHPRITCDGVQYQYETIPGSIYFGKDILTTHLPKPHQLKGDNCVIEGFIEYDVLPFITLTHEYYSEPFSLK